MKNKFLRALLYPHLALIVILFVISVALAVVVLATNVPPIVHYVSYGIWAYTLTVICVQIPKIVKAIKSFCQNNALIQRYNSNPDLKLKVSLFVSIAANLVLALVHLLSGLQSSSLWFVSLFIYYFVLAFLRGFLLINTRLEQDDLLKQWNRYRISGIILIVINLALGTIVFFMINHNRGAHYDMIVTIALAAYTFGSAAIAIVKAIKYKKSSWIVGKAVDVVRLAAVMVSVLSLQTAMLNAFSDETMASFKTTMTTIVGTVVCMCVFAIGVYMVVNSTKQISKLKQK